jgi:hypothetical protein
MRIFLSYAAEHRAIADSLTLRLRQEGHSVFFDRDELPAAESFDDRIRKGLRRSDLVVFLLSPESVATGAYAMTEMELARERWPNPSGRVLPVMVAPVPFAQIPGYLKAVTVLEPKGNTEADVAAAVERLTRAASKRRLAAGLAIVALVARVAAGAAFLFHARPEEREYRRTYYAGFSQMPESEAAIWLLGRRSDWDGSVVDGAYRLCNATGNAKASFANRLSYHQGDDRAIDQSEAKASVRVSLEPPLGQYSGAGLLYRKRSDRPDHYVFMLTAGGTVSLARVADSLRFLWSEELTGAARSGPVKLAVEGKGRQLRLYVDDRLVHTALDDPPLSGDPGVFALSTGCFVFDDVSVYLPAGGPSRMPR